MSASVMCVWVGKKDSLFFASATNYTYPLELRRRISVWKNERERASERCSHRRVRVCICRIYVLMCRCRKRALVFLHCLFYIIHFQYAVGRCTTVHSYTRCSSTERCVPHAYKRTHSLSTNTFKCGIANFGLCRLLFSRIFQSFSPIEILVFLFNMPLWMPLHCQSDKTHSIQ